MSRMLEAENLSCSSVKASNEINMRQFCRQNVKVGCLSSNYESEYQFQDVTSRSDFWKLAHELTVKHNHVKDHHQKPPVKLVTSNYHSDMQVSAFGNLNKIIRIKGHSQESEFTSIDTWSKPLNEVLQTNIRLEDVFHVINGCGMGVPFRHSVHILHGKLNYFLSYTNQLITDQRHALMIRDETINVLRMAVDAKQD